MNKILIRFSLGWFSLVLSVHADFPLRDMAVDQAIRLSDWRFQVEPPNSDVDWSTEDTAEARKSWREITVPAIWDKTPGEVRLPVPEQAAWYRTIVPVPELQSGQELALGFLGVKYVADVFVNGEYLDVHRGGYTPFVFSLPQSLLETPELEIVVRVDNRLNDRTIPKRRTGWEIYGGIDREVYLLTRPSIRPEKLFVQTRQNEKGQWQLQLLGDTLGRPTEPLSIRLLWQGQAVLEHQVNDWSDGIEVTLPLKDPELWSTDTPALHELEITWNQGEIRFPVGIREIKWLDGKLYLNNQALWLQGFGQHEFYPESGSILTSDQRRKDLERMKNLYGANTLRTGHYPQHPDLYSLADEIGLLLFSEIPAWQNPGQSLLEPEVWNNWIEPQLDDMLIHYRNHPSIFGWGVLNEIGGAHEYIRAARQRILQLDPTRGVAAVIASNNDFEINFLTDFAARNLHYGWYHSRSVYKLREGVDQNLRRANNLPVWVAELGGQSKPGKLGGGYSDNIRGTETYQDKMTRFGLQYIFSRAEEMAGISLWTWSDYEQGGKPHYHGILSGDRKPKLAAYTAMNLMYPDYLALGTEERSSVSAGEEFIAQLFAFSRQPEPEKKVNLIWQIRTATTVKKEGKISVTLADAYATPAGEVRWSVPPDQPSPLHFLYLELRDEKGKRLHSQAVPFEASDSTRPGIVRIPPHADGAEHVVEFYGMTFTVYPHTGFQLPLHPGGYELRLDGKVLSFSMQYGSYTDLTWDE